MPCAEIRDIRLDLALSVRKLRGFGSFNGHFRQDVTPIVPCKDCGIEVRSGVRRQTRTPTVTGISVEHLLDNEKLLVPVRLAPCMWIRRRRSVGDLGKTPLAVVPDPVNLRMLLQEGGSEGEIIG